MQTKSRGTKMFRSYMKNNPSEINYDKNANASAFSFSNFAMDIAAEELAATTREMVDAAGAEVAEAYTIDTATYMGGSFNGEGFWDAEAHTAPEGRPKYFYFHDITKGVIPYCYATSTGRLVYEGIQYTEDYPSEPPKRFDSFIAQVVDLVLEMAQDHAGAIATPDLFVNMAGYFKTVEEVKAKKFELAQAFQSMIFTFHRKVRPSGQSPFVNVTIADAPTLKEVFKQTPEQINIIKALQIEFLDEFIKGISGKPFRFPVTTANIALTPDTGDIADMEWLRAIAKYLKTGRLNIYISKDPRKFASCCRMSNDLDLLMDMAGVDSFGNGGVRIGSHRVVTLNLPKIIKDFNGDLEKVYEATVSASFMLKSHRELLRSLINHESGRFLKFFQHKWQDLDANFFSTVGIIGMWEASVFALEESGIDNPTIAQVIDKEKEILSFINRGVTKMSKFFSMPMNIEQIPGESSAADLGSEVGLPILSNQYIPLWEDVDLIDRIRYAGELDSFYTGGAITHLNIEKQLTEEAVIKLILMAAKAGMTHFAPNHVYSKCEDNHNTVGKHTDCPICGKPIVDYTTRIIGYFVPISSWNKHRKVEFGERKFTEKIT